MHSRTMRARARNIALGQSAVLALASTAVSDRIRLRQALGIEIGTPVSTHRGNGKVKSLNPDGTFDIACKDGSFERNLEPYSIHRS